MERRVISIRGIVQGVGFRPFVFGLASRMKLGGFVRNDDGAVLIEAEGESKALDRFITELSERAPALAKIESVFWEKRQPGGETEFRIETSHAGGAGAEGSVFISPDVATCEDCLRELFDLNNSRYRYPFINCTNCGPRLTIVTGAPYDRHRTTMASFAMCPRCQTEYDDPRDRRFHAQPTCCPRCGPRLVLLDGQGKSFPSENSLQHVAGALRAGRIVAIKGLGGFHLACTAVDEQVVHTLRQRKHRDEKPFAIMVADVAAARGFGEVGTEEAALLQSSARPIVLLSRKNQDAGSRDHAGNANLRIGSSVEDANQEIGVPGNPSLRGTSDSAWGARIADSVAPGNPSLGVMLPYTPMHHLLFAETGGLPLVMTSGNRSDEPIAYENDDAVVRLSGIADLFLVHNRPIHVRCDDSVTRVMPPPQPSPGVPAEGGRKESGASDASPARSESPIRRSRGYAPQPIRLPGECRVPTLAVGGQLKGTFALGRDRHAFVSHHLGDLDRYDAFSAFERDVKLYEELFDIRPRRIVHDLHPDYASTAYSRRRASAERLALVGVQHHHAHMASCMAENRLAESVIGVSFDGTGFGPDGAVWGGEFLIGDYSAFRRAAHLRYVRMPGGETAIREPWRMALAYLLDAGCDESALRKGIAEDALKTVRQMIQRGFNSPFTSSAGRLFDAVAALAGVRDRVSYEGQAAIELEWLARNSTVAGAYPFGIDTNRSGGQEKHYLLTVDLRPMLECMVGELRERTSASTVARRFHSTVVKIIIRVCQRLRNNGGPNAVVLSGGVFMNVLLTNEAISGLSAEGFRVFRHHLVPPNDAGLSLGQLAIAAARDNVSSPASISE